MPSTETPALNLVRRLQKPRDEPHFLNLHDVSGTLDAREVVDHLFFVVDGCVAVTRGPNDDEPIVFGRGDALGWMQNAESSGIGFFASHATLVGIPVPILAAFAPRSPELVAAIEEAMNRQGTTALFGWVATKTLGVRRVVSLVKVLFEGESLEVAAGGAAPLCVSGQIEFVNRSQPDFALAMGFGGEIWERGEGNLDDEAGSGRILMRASAPSVVVWVVD